MKFSIAAAALTLASTVVAKPHTCIGLKGAQKLVDRFITIRKHVDSDLGDYKVRANGRTNCCADTVLAWYIS